MRRRPISLKSLIPYLIFQQKRRNRPQTANSQEESYQKNRRIMSCFTFLLHKNSCQKRQWKKAARRQGHFRAWVTWLHTVIPLKSLLKNNCFIDSEIYRIEQRWCRVVQTYLFNNIARNLGKNSWARNNSAELVICSRICFPHRRSFSKWSCLLPGCLDIFFHWVIFMKFIEKLKAVFFQLSIFLKHLIKGSYGCNTKYFKSVC
jgi:hypothetical protein